MSHLRDEQLADYALGLLDEVARAEADAHLQACERCRAAATDADEALATFGFATLPPVKATPEARLRLLAATRPVQPIAHLEHADRVAKFFDIPAREARSILEKAANPAAWETTAFPGLHLLHLSPGPAFAGADAGLVRFDGGAQFPLHGHCGDERTLMLAGGVTFTDGSTLTPVQELLLRPGDKHAFTVFAEGALYATTLVGGIDIDGLGKVGTRRR